MASTRDQRRPHEVNTENFGKANSQELELETLILKTIEDHALRGSGILSRDELLEFIETDQFMLRMQMLTLEGKGLVKRTKLGCTLTAKAKERMGLR